MVHVLFGGMRHVRFSALHGFCISVCSYFSSLLSGNDLPGIASQFATQNLVFAMQFCKRIAKSCVEHMVHAVAIMQLLS